MGCLDTIERHARRLAPRGLEGLKYGSRHGLIDTQAADRQAGRGAPVAPASPAHIPRHAPGGAALDDLELAAAAPTPQPATPQRWSPFGRSTGCFCWQGTIGLQALLVLEKHVPADGARMRRSQHDAPLLQWLFPPCTLPGTSSFEHGLGLCAPIDEGSSLAGMGQHLVKPMPTGQLPEDVVARCPRVHLGQRQLRIAVPPHGLPGTPEVAKLLAHPVQGLLHLTVSDLFQAMVRRAHKAHRDFPHAMAAADFLFEGFPRSLTHQAHRICGPRALHAEDEAVVELAWIIDPIIIHAQGLRQSTAIDQMVPVPVVPRQA